jgi:hypothetical protein
MLITTRNRFAGLPDATDIPVEIMRPDDAAELFVRLASRPGLQASSREVSEVVGLFGGLPVVIAPMAGHLKRHRTWRVSDGWRRTPRTTWRRRGADGRRAEADGEFRAAYAIYRPLRPAGSAPRGLGLCRETRVMPEVGD